VVGAASRGIIQRGHESTAAMYKTYYAPNPFDNITEEDVEEYKEEIERKTRGPGIDACLLSTQFLVGLSFRHDNSTTATQAAHQWH